VNSLTRAVAEICTCSMLTVTVLLLYRKLIPLWCLPWCGNLITLGCRRILLFLCFSKVKKNRRVVRAFRFPGRQPPDQIGWNSERMLSERSPTKLFLRIMIFFSLKSYAFFFAGSPTWQGVFVLPGIAVSRGQLVVISLGGVDGGFWNQLGRSGQCLATVHQGILRLYALYDVSVV